MTTLDNGKIAAKPLFRDPVFDGAADPVVVWNRHELRWFMFYTNRRASEVHLPGVSWVYGSPIGIAESTDGGATWSYCGTAEMDYAEGGNTYWAPDVTYHDGFYHMYLTFVPDIRTEWGGTCRIDHLISTDLLNWEYQSTLLLASDKVIDAAVLRLPDGARLLYYNNEANKKSVYYADSADLYTWRECGKVLGDKPGEGPKAFRWCGLGVYHSTDTLHWTRQANLILGNPGHGVDDQVIGNHADVVVSGDRAYLFYFTHPGRHGPNAGKDTFEQRRTSIQVAELALADGQIEAMRDDATYIQLQPPVEIE